MNIVNITLGVDTQPCSSITLGRRGENEVTQVVIDFSSWVEEFGAGVITLLAMRSQDTSAYPVVLTLDGNTATWDVTSTDTAYKGSGRAEYIYTVGEQIAKSVVFGTTVLQDIGEPSETPPDPYEDWLERLTELGAETQANAEAAQQSAENAAESAEDAAQSAASVEGAVEQAEAARDAAMAAQVASEAARDAAQTAQASAEASATVASGSAASAAGSATAAAGSASDASASASAAGASASAASDSATAAGDAETQAEAAKTAAQAAQSAAEDAAEDAQQAAQQAHVEYEQLSGEVDDLSDEVTQQKSAIDDLTALTNRKAGMLVDTASGAIASFVPDATVPNLMGVTVDVEPVQDLHGYDSPWPAGGGVNKFDVGAVTSADFSISDGTFTNTQTDTRTFFQLSVQQFNNGVYVKSVAAYSAANTGRIFAKISGIEAGITSLIIKHNGKKRDLVLCNYPWTGTDDLWISLNIVSNNPTVAGGLVISGIQLEIASAGSTQASAFAPYSNECPISGWDAVDIWNKTTHDTSADPTVTIQLGQTVYGGTLDVTTGTLTVTESKIIVDGTKFSWSYYNGAFYASFSEYKKGVEYTAMSDYLRFVPQNTSVAALIAAGRGTFSFRRDSTSHLQLYPTDESIASSQMLNAYLNEHPLTIVYPLATPITIQLDPATISTISGQTNNVWADAGDVSVEFAADVKTYIDNKIAAAVAALS